MFCSTACVCVWYPCVVSHLVSALRWHSDSSTASGFPGLRRLAPSVRRGAHRLQPRRGVIAFLLPLAAPKMRVHGPRPQAVRVALLGPNPCVLDHVAVRLVTDRVRREGERGALVVQARVSPLLPEAGEARAVLASADDHDVDKVEVVAVVVRRGVARPARGGHERLDGLRRPEEAAAAGPSHDIHRYGVLAHRALRAKALEEASEPLDVVALRPLMVDLDADVVRPRGLARVGARLLGELAVGKEIVAVELEASDGEENLAVAVLRSLAKQMCVLDERLRHAIRGRVELRRIHEGERDRVSRRLRGGQPVGELASGCVAEADGGTVLLKVAVQRVALPAAGLL